MLRAFLRTGAAGFAALVFTAVCVASEEPATPEPGPAAEAPAETAALPGLLDLDRALRIALRDNPSLKAAEERVKQAKARIDQARAAYYPQVTAGMNLSKRWLSENEYSAARDRALESGLTGFRNQLTQAARGALSGQTPVNVAALGRAGIEGYAGGLAARGLVEDSTESHSANLTAAWLVFDGFERKFQLAVSRFAHQESAAAYSEAQRLLLSAVASTYYRGQLARENLQIARADAEFNQRLLDEAKARRRVGTGSLSDELNFEIRVNAARSQVLSSERDYAVEMVALAELLGIPTVAFDAETQLAELSEETPDEMTAPEREALIAFALEHRPDLQRSRYAVNRSEASVGAARAAFFPTVSVSASKNALRTDNAKFREDDFGTTIGLNLSYTVFAGGRNKAGHALARAARSEAERTLDAAEIGVAADVASIVEALTNAQSEVLLQRENAEYVQRNRDLVEKEYKAGVGSLVRLNEAQRDLVQAQGRLALALASLRNAWFALKTATGESLAHYIE